jgi:outer membrane protein assembly factor BamB/serine/threonine protein kinase
MTYMAINDLTGQTLGKYRLEQEIGRGAMAVVYRATDTALNRQVALKVLPTYFSHDPEFVRRFQREARVAAGLSHPGIVQIYDVGEAPDGTLYIAMQEAGETLKHMLQREGPLPLARALAIAEQVAAALDYAHRRGVIHRDVKASNILVSQGDQAMLADFGIARVGQESGITAPGFALGTPEYLAPEQAEAGKPVDYRADLYALGVVLFEMLTGRVPFSADRPEAVLHAHIFTPPPSPSRLNPALPEAVSQVLLKALAKDPGERYQSGAALVAALRAAQPEQRSRGAEVQKSSSVPLLPDTSALPQPAPATPPAAATVPPSPTPAPPDLTPSEQRRGGVEVQRISPAPLPPGTSAPQPARSWSFLIPVGILAVLILCGGLGLLTIAALRGTFQVPSPTLTPTPTPTWNVKPGTPTALPSPTPTPTPTLLPKATVTLTPLPPTPTPRPPSPTPTRALDLIPTPSGVQWLMFHQGVDHSGAAPGQFNLPLEKRWEFVTGGPINMSSPAVVGGTAYIGSQDGKLYAVDIATGRQRWAFNAGGRIESSPAVAQGIVYFGAHNGKVYAVDSVRGEKLWEFATGDKVESSPAVIDGVVYIGSDDRRLYALDAATGHQKWAFQAERRFFSSPAVVAGMVFVGNDDSKLYAVDVTTGAKRWEFLTGWGVGSSPTVALGTVYVGSLDNKVYALDAQTGAKRWEFATFGGVLSSPAVAEGMVYVGSLDHTVYALDAATGRQLWAFQTGASVTSSPAVASGVVFIGSDDRQLYALDAATGRQLWTFATGDKVLSSPAIADGLVFVGSWDGKLYAFAPTF